jgi:lipooligosaccharide transport system permease protein
VLTGLAFAPVLMAWAVTRTGDTSFSVLMRFLMVPLFLFSGTFFPVTQIPAWLRPIAYLTPLWHGVELSRALSMGTVAPGAAAVHVGYLLVLAAAGFGLAHVTYRRRLHE